MDGAHGPGIDTPAGYTRLRRVSTSADADIFRAWDSRGRWVTLKLFQRYAGGRAQEAAFAGHCATSVGLGRHPAVLPVRAGGITATGRPWLALDMVDGVTLAEALRRAGPPPAEALRIAIVLADALSWAHTMRRPMAHGRLQPADIILDPSGFPLLTDFAAPGRPGPAPTVRGDVTALGALLFLMVTGNAWPGDADRDGPVLAAWPGLTGLLDEVLTPVPAITSMAEFARRLRLVSGATGPIVAQPTSPSRPPGPSPTSPGRPPGPSPTSPGPSPGTSPGLSPSSASGPSVSSASGPSSGSPPGFSPDPSPSSPPGPAPGFWHAPAFGFAPGLSLPLSPGLSLGLSAGPGIAGGVGREIAGSAPKPPQASAPSLLAPSLSASSLFSTEVRPPVRWWRVAALAALVRARVRRPSAPAAPSPSGPGSARPV